MISEDRSRDLTVAASQGPCRRREPEGRQGSETGSEGQRGRERVFSRVSRVSCVFFGRPHIGAQSLGRQRCGDGVAPDAGPCAPEPGRKKNEETSHAAAANLPRRRELLCPPPSNHSDLPQPRRLIRQTQSRRHTHHTYATRPQFHHQFIPPLPLAASHAPCSRVLSPPLPPPLVAAAENACY